MPRKKKETKKAMPAGKEEKAPKKKVKRVREKVKAPKAAPEVEKKKVAPPPPEKIETPPVEEVKMEKAEVKPREKKKTKETVAQYYGIGGRKTSLSRVWLTAGQGKIEINGKPLEEYVSYREVLKEVVRRPLKITDTVGRYDVLAKITGGGVASQADALSHGIARALIELNPDFKVPLKREGLLTRDPRVKERKKYGRKRARKRFQYTKR